MTTTTTTAIFNLDNRKVECSYYKSIGNVWVLTLIRDAGHYENPDRDQHSPQYIGNRVRRQFNRRNWAVVTEAVFNTLKSN